MSEYRIEHTPKTCTSCAGRTPKQEHSPFKSALRSCTQFRTLHGRLKQAFAGAGLNPQAAALLQDALAAAGSLAQATDEVTALGAPAPPEIGADGRALAALSTLPSGGEGGATGELAAERSRVLDELTHGVEGISARLSAVTTRAGSLATQVQPPGVRTALQGMERAWLADELNTLDQDARAAAVQLDALIQEVRSTQDMTATAVGNLDRAASYLRESIGQFRLQT